MADRRLHQLSDIELGATLVGLSPAIAWPSAGAAGEPDLATAVRVRAGTLPVPGERGAWSWLPRWWLPGARSARRALVLALVALLAVAAIAGAVGLGLPGLRLILGETPPTSPPTLAPATEAPGSTSPGPLGRALRLGEALDPDDPESLDGRAGFHVSLPDDPDLVPPDAAWIDDRKGGQVTILWATREGLPATSERDVGLLLGQFRGTMDFGYFNKVISGGTVVEPVRVAGERGYWLSGDPHVFFWEGPDGLVDDPRRWVGDALLWSDGSITYRLETSLGR
ncbi:MAG: hypothetical protein WEE50_02315, partial [Chloroflexota bacterium]